MSTHYGKSLGIWTAAVVITWLALNQPGEAAVISIDFDQDNLTNTYSNSATTAGGLVPLAGQVGPWNRLEVGTSGETTKGTFNFSPGSTNSPVASSLLDGSGTTTGVSFTFNTGSGVYGDFTHASTTDLLGEDVAVVNGSTSPSIGWRYDGLLPNSPYSIRIFGQTDTSNVPSNFATFTVAGGTPASATPTSGQNYVDFTVTSSGLGVVTGTFDFVTPGSGNQSMAGIQIQGTFASGGPIPEPGAFVLAFWALAGMACAAWRRRV